MRLPSLFRLGIVILLILALFTISKAGELTNVKVLPDDVVAGAISIYCFAFTTSDTGNGIDNGLPADAKIEITFPQGFTISTVLFAATKNSNMTGGFGRVFNMGRVLTLERDSTGNDVGKNVDILVGVANVVNPVSIESYTVNIRTLKNDGTEIDSGISTSFAIEPGEADHFVISFIDQQTAGREFNIKITAQDKAGNTATSFVGSANLQDLTGTISLTTTDNFIAGVWTGSVSISESTLDDKITITSPGKSGESNSFIVNPALLHHFRFTSITSPQTAGTQFPLTIIAEDAFGNQVTEFTGVVNLSDDSGTLTPEFTEAFINGFWSGNVTINTAQNDVIIKAVGAKRTGISNPFNVVAGKLDHFQIESITTQFAGEAFVITVIAVDNCGNRVSTFSGTMSISDKTEKITPKTSGNFSAGQWTGNVTISQAYINNTITVRQTVGTEIGISNSFNVLASGVDHFAIDPISSPQMVGKAFAIKVTAQDKDNNAVTSFTGQLSLSDLTGSISPTLTGHFINGVWQDTISIKKSRLANAITVTNGSRAGTSNAFDVVAAALHHFIILPITSPQTAGVAFSITIKAVDKYENIVINHRHRVHLSIPGGIINPSITGNFIGGVWTDDVQIPGKARDVFILASYNSIIGQSNSFNVEPAGFHHIILRDQPGGFGSEIGEVILTLDDKLQVYAAGYDRYNNYVRDVHVKWQTTGTLDAPSPAFGTTTTLDPVTPASSGFIIGDTARVIPDTTGLITVGSITYVKIRTAPGNQGVELGDYHITTDDSITLYAAGYDGGGNYLGEVSVFWQTTGTLFPFITDTSTSLTFSPIKSGRQGRIRISHTTATGDETGSIHVSAGKPTGQIVLTPKPNTLPADGLSTAIIRSNSIYDTDSNWIDPNTLFTVMTTEGQIIAPPDASDEYNGWQVAAADSGIVSFILQAATHGGTAYISINSLNSGASGATIVNISSLNILKVYAAKSTVSQKQVGVPVSVEVENVGNEGVSNISTGLKFIGPAPYYENRNFDYPVVTRTDRITNIPGNSIQVLTFMISVGTAALNDTITIDSWVSGKIGQSVVSDSNANITDFWVVQTPAQFSIQCVEAFADTVSQGLNNVSVSMIVKNIGEATASITAPSLSFWSVAENRYVPADYEIFPSPYNPQIILGLNQEHLNFTLNVATTASLDKVRIDGLISGTDINSGMVIDAAHADTTDSWIVERAPIIGITSFKASQNYVTRGQTVPWEITMTVNNSGTTPVRLDSSNLKFIFSGQDITNEYQVIVPFEFMGSGSTDLAGSSQDSLRFNIMRTGITLGPITVEGSIYLKDLRTMKSMQRSQTTGISVQNPANLVVRKVIPAQTSATINQTIDWTIIVVISNDGEGDITIDNSPDSTYISFNPSDGFLISQPSALAKSGDLILRGGQIDTLIFRIDKTGGVLGWTNVITHVTGTENNSGKQVYASSTENIRIKIEKPAQLRLYSVVNKAPNPPFVNTGQNYKIQVRVQNPGDADTDGVHDVEVVLVSDGNSIDTLRQTISSVPAGSIRSVLFDIIASEETNPQERFIAKIISAKSDNTNENIALDPALDLDEIVVTQTPAKLRILDVNVPSSIFADQHKPWDIFVVVIDSGSADVVLKQPSTQDVQVYINDKLQRDYIIEPPAELKSGGFTLSAGKRDTLIYTVTNTGEKSGNIQLIINLQAEDRNDQRAIHQTASASFYVQTSVKISIEQTLLRGCYIVDEQRGRVNKEQAFQITAIIKNYGFEPVDDIYVQLRSNGGSLISETKSVIHHLDPSITSIDSVYYTIIADSIEGTEMFTAHIVSGTVRSSGIPALVEPKYDSTAITVIQQRATLQPKIIHGTGDNNFTVNQVVTIKTMVHNLGDAMVDDSGVLEFLAPENYQIISPAGDTTIGSAKSVFKPDREIEWHLLTPTFASGPDLLILSIAKVPMDLNSKQPAFIAARHDTFSVQTLATKLYVNSIEIVEPRGARDQIISARQDFQVQAVISYSKNLSNVIAKIEPPQSSGFRFINRDQVKTHFEPGPVIWDMQAPDRARKILDTLRLEVIAYEKGKQISVEDSSLWVKTIDAARIKLQALISDPPGAKDGKLTIGQEFEIKASVDVENERGAAGIYGESKVKLNLGVTGIKTVDSLIQSFNVGQAAIWKAIAPPKITTGAEIVLTLLEAPNDENTDKPAIIGIDEDKASISVRTDKIGEIQTTISIYYPQGAKDGSLSTGQKFELEALVNSEGVNDIDCELHLPNDKSFSLIGDDDRIKRVNAERQAVRWKVRAPNDTARSANLWVAAQGKDRNSGVPIYGNPDSLSVAIVEKAKVILKASIIAPYEAMDHFISLGTKFVIQAEVENRGIAQISGDFSVELDLPQNDYTSEDTLIKSMIDGPLQWTIQAPKIVKRPKNITVKWNKKPLDINTDSLAATMNEKVELFISTEEKRLVISPIENATARSVTQGSRDITLLSLQFENIEEGEHSTNVLLRGLKLGFEDRNGQFLAAPDKVISRLAAVRSSNHSIIYAESELNLLKRNPIMLPFLLADSITSTMPDSLSLVVDIAKNAKFNNFRIKIDSTSWFDAIIEQTENMRPIVTDGTGKIINAINIASDYTVILESSLKATFLNYPNPFGSKEYDKTIFSYYLKKDADIELSIYSLIGELVWKQHFSASDPQGKAGMHDTGNLRPIFWDAINGNGHRVINGVYIALFLTNYGETATTKTAIIK